MDKSETKPAAARRYTVSYRAEDGSKLEKYNLKAEDSFTFDWDRPEAPGALPALLKLLDVRMAPEGYDSINGFFYADPEAHRNEATRLVLGPMTHALEAIWDSAVEIKVSEEANNA